MKVRKCIVMRKIALIAIGIAAAVAGGYLMKSLLSTPDVSIRARQAPDIQLEQTRLTHTAKDGSKIWEITAEAVSVRENMRETLATGVIIEFFKDDRAMLKVQAKELRLKENGDMFIKGEVSAAGDDDLNFQSRGIHWDEERKLLWSDAAVKLERADMNLTGVGFEYSPETGTLKIKQKAYLKIIKK